MSITAKRETVSELEDWQEQRAARCILHCSSSQEILISGDE
jgi:hypothetical protein